MKKTLLAMLVMSSVAAAQAAVSASNNNQATVEGDTLGGTPNNVITIDQTTNSNMNTATVLVDSATDNMVGITQSNTQESDVLLTLPGEGNEVTILQNAQENSSVTLTASGIDSSITIKQDSSSGVGFNNSISAEVSANQSTVMLTQEGLNDNSLMDVAVLNGFNNTVTATQGVDDISNLALVVDGSDNIVTVTQNSPAGGGDENLASIEILGDMSDLTFTQSGYGNDMDIEVGGNGNKGTLSQEGDFGQVLTVDVAGDGNILMSSQSGSVLSTGLITVDGHTNNITLTQAGDGGHQATVTLINDSNVVGIMQTDMNNTATVDLNADGPSLGSAGNAVTINQGSSI